MRLSFAASGKIGLVSVRLCDSGHRASPTSPRLKRGITFGLGQRSGNSSTLKTTACTADSTQGDASHWVHVPWGNCASRSPSHEEGVALLVARTCNEVVPAHKQFLRARQTPVPLICIFCWVLACTVPGTRYAAPGTRGSRVEYVQRVLVYNTTAAVRIL